MAPGVGRDLGRTEASWTCSSSHRGDRGPNPRGAGKLGRLMERVYLDSVAFIYFVEQRQPWFVRIHRRLTAAPVRLVVSDLTRMECRVKPISTGNSILLAAFDIAFAGTDFAIISTAVFDRATLIRAKYK